MVIIKDKRIGCLIWLLCSDMIAGLGFWYPEHIANRNASPDDRFGMVLLAGTPFYIIGGIIAVLAMLGLFVLTRGSGLQNQLFLFTGALMAVFSLTPLFIIGCRVFFR